jgi:hypothetical protein
MTQQLKGSMELTGDLVARIRDAARQRRRERVILELACIDWELSHLDNRKRAEVERSLGKTFGVSAVSEMLEESVRGLARHVGWTEFFQALGL